MNVLARIQITAYGTVSNPFFAHTTGGFRFPSGFNRIFLRVWMNSWRRRRGGRGRKREKGGKETSVKKICVKIYIVWVLSTRQKVYVGDKRDICIFA